MIIALFKINLMIIINLIQMELIRFKKLYALFLIIHF
jgi:hypothetical protein